MAGVTIATLTGSDSAPSKANEAAQKNDIGAAKDDVSLAVTNAITEAYQTAYVETGVSAGEASTKVGTEVIKTIAQKYQTNNQIGKATIEIEGFGTINSITSNATVTIYTKDFEVEGTIYKNGGQLTWGEIGLNVPGIKLDKSSIEIYENTEQGVNARFKQIPEDTITWTSNSAKAIVTVDQNDSKKATIKGITKTGDDEKVTIKAQSGDYSATIEVVVTEKPLPLWNGTKRDVILSTTQNTELEDNKGNKIWIPAKFKISKDNADNGDAGNNIEEGTIIEDASGNQFVWVPVGTITKSDDSTVEITLSRRNYGSLSSSFSEQYARFSETSSNTWARKTSDNSKIEAVVQANSKGGFYIGRYETGSGNVCKYNATSYVNLTMDNSLTKAQQMYEGNETLYKSDLINSYAWDTTLYFMQQCGTNNNYANQIGKSKTSNKQNTGKNCLFYDTDGITELTDNRLDVQCNIYDMAGNVLEWTTEYYETSSYPSEHHCYRGGKYDKTNYNAGTRIHADSSPRGVDSPVGFRTILYLM